MHAAPLSLAPSPDRPATRRGAALLEGILLALFVCCWTVSYVGLCPPDPARPAHHRVQA